MSDAAPIPAPSLDAEPPYQTRPSRETRRHLLAALFSAIVPGAGQLFLGQRRKGSTLLATLVLLLVCFWPLRLLRSYPGFVSLYCFWIVLYLYAACSAQLAGSVVTRSRPSKWWLLAVVPVGVLTLSLLGRLVTRSAGFRSFSVPSTSMEKTINRGDQIVTDISYYRFRPPARQDVIVFLKDKEFFIKRIVAIGGDSIQGENGVVFVNGQHLDEPYVEHTGDPPNWMTDFGPITVPAGELFVMGDNRDISLDSRSPEFGLPSATSIIGKPLYVYNTDRTGASIK